MTLRTLGLVGAAALAGACTLAWSAYAAGDPMAGLYGNTLICRSAKSECHVWYSPDGTWKSGNMIEDDKGEWNLVGAEGTFRIVNGGLCRTDSKRKVEGCAGASEVGHKLGDNWTAPSPRDPSLIQSYEIVAGHH